MTMARAGADDPFQDPSLDTMSTPLKAPSSHTAVDDTLDVGRNAHLTLGTDALVVVDEALAEKKASLCCGVSFGSGRAVMFL